ncbi:hypothetical protein [Flavobacterium sp. RS13.1]|uniref:hypothetical protein n=1 Tax=Flavobacterium sp. RS13.1 TaxID=3400345 RepID=UPI003AAB9CE1
MKKTIGILSVVVIAVTMFVNNNSVNSLTQDTNLANLIALNTANAEDDDKEKCACTDIATDICYYGWSKVTYCYPTVGPDTCK